LVADQCRDMSGIAGEAEVRDLRLK
jgi:hypothetical protein